VYFPTASLLFHKISQRHDRYGAMVFMINNVFSARGELALHGRRQYPGRKRRGSFFMAKGVKNIRLLTSIRTIFSIELAVSFRAVNK
jgi:hypothetical protein